MKKSEIIETIKEWIENIDCDIKSTDWIDQGDKPMAITQKTQLCLVLGLLENLGENNNIPQ